jgi:exodeoxyribonuclease VII small subunit
MQEPTFEGSLKRLEEIVAQLEDNKLALEQSLQVFEEGVKLVRFCAGRLDEAERRIEILLADKEGQLHVAPFPEGPEDTTGAAERP